MSLRDDLQGTVNDARQLVDDLGLRPHVVIVRTTTWSGGTPGSGTAAHVDLTLSPTPRVRDPSPRLRAIAPGLHEDGDRTVDRISRDYTEAQLGTSGLAAGVERLWLIDGEKYRAVGKPEEKNFEWRVQLRRLARKAGS